MATIGVTEAAVFQKEKASMKALKARHATLIMGKRIWRLDTDVAVWGASVAVPLHGTATANEVGDDGSVSPTTDTPTEITVTLNQEWESSFQITDRVLKQSHQKNLIEVRSEEAGIALGEQLEVALLGLYSGLSQSTTAIADVDEDTILDAVRQLDNANAPQKDRFGIGKPSQKIAIHKIARYTEDAIRAGSGKQITTGQISLQTHGIRWAFSTLVVTASAQAKNLIWQRDFAGLAVQRKVSVEELDRSGLRRTFVASHLYGYGEARDDHAVVVATTSNSGT